MISQPKVSVVGRTPSYVSPFSSAPVVLGAAAPAAAAYYGSGYAFYYTVTIPTNTVVDKLWVALGASNIAKSVAYAGGTWVGVGDTGFIATSTDGSAWTSRSSGVTSNLTSVAYGGGTWVAVGANGVVRTSTDLVTWSAAASPGFTTTQVNAVAYDGTTNWVAVGGTAVRYATNAAGTWTSAASPGFTGVVNAVAYGGGTWVAANNAGSIRYATDPTGTWSAAASSGFSTTAINGVAYDGSSRWVAVGNSGVVTTTTTASGTWSAPASSGFAAQALSAIAYGGSAWVASSVNTESRYATDAAGTWTAMTSTNYRFSPTLYSYSAAYSGSNWLAVAYGGAFTGASASATFTPGNAWQVGLYRSDGSNLFTGAKFSPAYGPVAVIRYDASVSGTNVPPGTYLLALWCNDTANATLFRSSNANNRARARFVESSLTSGLPTTATPVQDTTGLVYLFGFTTK